MHIQYFCNYREGICDYQGLGRIQILFVDIFCGGTTVGILIMEECVIVGMIFLLKDIVFKHGPNVNFLYMLIAETKDEMATDQKRELLEHYGLNPDEFLSEHPPKVTFLFLRVCTICLV